MIYYSIPFDSSKRIGRYYNAFMRLLPEASDFACFVDGDATFTTVDFGRQLEGVVARHPECGLFYGCTNRIGCRWQRHPEADRGNNDIAYHRALGRRLADLHGTDCAETSALGGAPGSGVLLLTQKRVWQAAGGFREEGMLGVDWDYYRRVRGLGEPIKLMTGVYVYHWYRFGRPRDTSHLLPDAT